MLIPLFVLLKLIGGCLSNRREAMKFSDAKAIVPKKNEDSKEDEKIDETEKDSDTSEDEEELQTSLK